MRPPPTAVTTDRAVFPKLDVVGWYCTGDKPDASHLALHAQVCVGWVMRVSVCACREGMVLSSYDPQLRHASVSSLP